MRPSSQSTPGRGHSSRPGPRHQPERGNHGILLRLEQCDARLRAADGRITTFEARGAGSENVSELYLTPGGVWGGQGTYSVAINPAGKITGFYFDGSNVAHSFLRDPEGRFTTFDASYPYAGLSPGQGTFAGNISPRGAIAGYTVDTRNVLHGFPRAPSKFVASIEYLDQADAPPAATVQGGQPPEGLEWITAYSETARWAGLPSE